MIPGRKFSSTTSASAASRRTSSQPAGSREVDGDRALAGVLLAEVGALGPLAELPGDVALGRLDLDDVGAEVGEHAAGERAGEDTAEVEDLHAVEWVCHGAASPKAG